MPYLPVPRMSYLSVGKKQNKTKKKTPTTLTRWHQMDVYHGGLETIPPFKLEENAAASPCWASRTAGAEHFRETGA